MRRQKAMAGRAGFSLIGVIVILAVIAILAGALTPAVFRRLMEARERDTTAELAILAEGLRAFYSDTGRFPTDGEGLAALVSDPGVTGWGGPYVELGNEEPTTQVANDAWNLAYAYDEAPTTNPAGTASVLIASGGQDRTVDAGSVGATWSLAGTSDDLIELVDAAAVDRVHAAVGNTELERLGEAVQAYFQDQGEYPTNLSQVVDSYLDPGVGSDALFDEWQRSYVLSADNTAVPPVLSLSSVGPDGSAGGGDDVVLALDSVIPGRRTTYYELGMIQAAVDAAAATALSGDWTGDLGSFSLASVLGTDGWGNPYEEQMSTRTILSGGPDADYFTPDDNIPPGVVPDDVTPPAGDGIEYVDGTGTPGGPHCDQFAFDVINTTASDIVLTDITLTWSSPTAYYAKVRLNGTLVVNSSNPKISSGETAVFGSPFTLVAGATLSLDIQSFVSKVSKGGSKVDMSNVDISVELSDGSTFTFNTGPC